MPDTFASPGGQATAAWYGSMPPRWVEDTFYDAFGGRDTLASRKKPGKDDIETLTAIDKRLCTTWRLDAVPSEQVRLPLLIPFQQLNPNLSRGQY